MFLCGCGESSPTKPQAHESIKGCDIPAKWEPQLILDDMVVEGFHAENAVKDPDALTQLNTLYAQGRPGSSLDFEKWFGQNEDRPQTAVRGMTMAKWESLLIRAEFPHQSEVYPAVCGGWTFESYLQKHPEINNQTVDDYMKKFPIPGFPSITPN